MLVLAGAGAHKAGVLDLSPAHTAQMALAPEGPAMDVEGARYAALVTPAEAAAEARAAPLVVESAAHFDPAHFASRTGRVVQTGRASFYGDALAGRPTASGEAFDPAAFTAAHKTLPLGSILRVTNTANGRQAVVRVNDRGPYVPGRVLDVSRGAAEALGMTHSGTAHLRIERL